MFTFEELIEAIEQRYTDVPNVTDTDVELWVVTALAEHGLTKNDVISSEVAALVMLHAEADGASQIAFKTAHYFKFSDKDESVDKSMISQNYREAADALWARYRRKRAEGVGGIGGSVMHFMRRIDREIDG